MTATTETVGGTPFTTSATYNDAGQVLSQTYPNGDTLATSYDPLSGWQDQLSLTPSGGSTVNLLTAEAYNGAAGALGLMTSATLGAFSGGVGSYAASYDLLGRLTSESATYTPSGGSASTLYQVQPTYDALGNVIESVTTLPQGVDTQVFCYDDLARLTWAGSSGTPVCSGAPTPSDTGSLAGTGGASYTASYTYDTLNRLTSGPLGSYSYGDAAHVDAATAIGSAWSASYDAAGNLTCRAATSATTCAGVSPTGAALSYDNQGQLATWANAQSSPTSSASYLYDGEGQRVEQVATTSGVTTTTTYVGALEEIATTGTTTTTTAYYGKTALSVNGTLSYTLSDQLGSVSEAVNAATGAVTASQLYDAYGQVRYSTGTMPTAKGFTGQYTDANTGLEYDNARYYDSVSGAFISADSVLPKHGAAPDPSQLNRYAYVGANPETKTDPSGHCPMCITALVGAAIGFTVGFGGDVAIQLATNGGNLKTVDYGTAFKYGAGGAVAGALVGLLGPGGTVLANTALEYTFASLNIVSYSGFAAGFVVGATEGGMEAFASGETNKRTFAETVFGSGIAGVVGAGVGNSVGRLSEGVLNAEGGWLGVGSSLGNATANASANVTANAIEGNPQDGYSVVSSFGVGLLGGAGYQDAGPWVQAGAVGVMDFGAWLFFPQLHGTGNRSTPQSQQPVARQSRGRSRFY